MNIRIRGRALLNMYVTADYGNDINSDIEAITREYIQKLHDNGHMIHMVSLMAGGNEFQVAPKVDLIPSYNPGDCLAGNIDPRDGQKY